MGLFSKDDVVDRRVAAIDEAWNSGYAQGLKFGRIEGLMESLNEVAELREDLAYVDGLMDQEEEVSLAVEATWEEPDSGSAPHDYSSLPVQGGCCYPGECTCCQTDPETTPLLGESEDFSKLSDRQLVYRLAQDVFTDLRTLATEIGVVIDDMQERYDGEFDKVSQDLNKLAERGLAIELTADTALNNTLILDEGLDQVEKVVFEHKQGFDDHVDSLKMTAFKTTVSKKLS